MNNFNIDYLSFFKKLLTIQLNLTEEIFTKKIKFINPEETWKQFTSHSNNILIFFDILSVKNKILFIKYLNYYLLSSEEKLILLKKIINEINEKIIIFNNCDSENFSKINIIELYDELFNHYNNEEIIIEYSLNYNVNHDKDIEINMTQIIEDIKNWINNFKLNCDKHYENKLTTIED